MRVISPTSRLYHRESATAKQLGFAMLALAAEYRRKVVKRVGHYRVAWPMNHLLNRESTAVERLSFVVLSLTSEQKRKTSESCGYIWVF